MISSEEKKNNPLKASIIEASVETITVTFHRHCELCNDQGLDENELELNENFNKNV